MRQFRCSDTLTRKGDGAGNLGRGSDGGVVVRHSGNKAICVFAGSDLLQTESRGMIV